MLAVVTHKGISLVDPASFKNPLGSFPISTSLECSTNLWSLDNSQLYIASSSFIRRYTPSECLLEEIYHGSDAVACLAIKDKSDVLFFAAGNKVWSLDCAPSSSGEILSTLGPHKETVNHISISNDGTLLVSVSASAVLVHNLVLSSHARLKGLPDGKPVACCMFHRHSRTRLLLGVGRDVMVYDSTKPSGSLKTVRVPGGGDIVGVATSPFSKTLIAAVTSSGDVALVDIDKDNGILKAVNVGTSLSCCAFTAEGAAIYLGTESGRLLILDLRSLEKEPRSFTIGDGNAPVKEINVQTKTKSGTISVKARSSSTMGLRSSPRSVSSARTTSAVASLGIKSPEHMRAVPKDRGGGASTQSRKLFSPARTPLSETRNSGLSARPASSHSPLSRRIRPLKFQRGKNQEENHGTRTRPPSPHELTEAKQRTGLTPSQTKMGQEIDTLGLGSVPESISGHMATVRIRSGSHLNGGPGDGSDRPRAVSRRVVSESVASASRGLRTSIAPIGSSRSKRSSPKSANGAVPRTRQEREWRSATPDNSDDRLDLSSPELPCEPVTPISLEKNKEKVPSAGAMGSGLGVLERTSSEVTKWAKSDRQKGKGKERIVERKQIRFAQDPDVKESSAVGDEDELVGLGPSDEEREGELSLQVSPRRPTAHAPPMWLQSPHRKSAANLNMSTTAQDFLRNIVHDVMYDFQRETKAEMMGLHLDLVRMGRGWKQEIRDVMEEWSEEIRELKAENRRLREENTRLRRGY